MKKIEDLKSKAIACAKQCKTKTEFFKKFPKEHSFCKTLDIFDEACSHMLTKKQRHYKEWDENPDIIYDIVDSFETRSEFATESHMLYEYCREKKILNKICANMKKDYTKNQEKQIVYYVMCSSDTEKFIKIGKTARDLEKRLATIPYTIEDRGILEAKKLAFCVEQFLLHKFNSYKPLKSFSGDGECLDISCLEEIQQIFKNRRFDVEF